MLTLGSKLKVKTEFPLEFITEESVVKLINNDYGFFNGITIKSNSGGKIDLYASIWFRRLGGRKVTQFKKLLLAREESLPLQWSVFEEETKLLPKKKVSDDLYSHLMAILWNPVILTGKFSSRNFKKARTEISDYFLSKGKKQPSKESLHLMWKTLIETKKAYVATVQQTFLDTFRNLIENLKASTINRTPQLNSPQFNSSQPSAPELMEDRPISSGGSRRLRRANKLVNRHVEACLYELLYYVHTFKWLENYLENLLKSSLHTYAQSLLARLVQKYPIELYNLFQDVLGNEAETSKVFKLLNQLNKEEKSVILDF